MIKVNVISNNIGWRKFLKEPDIYIEKKIKKLNKKNKIFKKKFFFCTLLLSDNKKIKQLNKKFRNKNTSTDVLSFPFYRKSELKKKLKKDKEIYIGDIIVNYNKILNKNNVSDFKLEFDTLWVHGLLHLFGHDHKKNKDFLNMAKEEKKFLSYLN
jgi:probable rRNA maturation factor